MRKTLDDNALFSVRLDNCFSALNLRDEADDLRNPFVDELRKFNQNPAKSFNDFTEFYKKKLETDFLKNGGILHNRTADGGFSQSNSSPYTRYSSNIFTDKTGKQFTSGFTQTNLIDELFTSFERTGGFSESSGGKGFGNNIGGFFRRDRSFTDLTTAEKQKFITDSTDPDGNNLRYQQRLDRQVFAAQNSGALNDEQRKLVDRKLISLTQGVDPSKLTENQRDVAAQAREREAARIDQNEARAREQRDAQIALHTRSAISNEKLIQIGGKSGSKAIELLLKDQTSAGGAAAGLTPALTSADTANAYYDENGANYRIGDTHKAGSLYRK